MVSQAVGLVLAGGQGKRLGGVDKAFVRLKGRPLIHHVIDLLRPQVQCIVINANGDPERFTGLEAPVVPDPIQPPIGPLGGILAGMSWTQQNKPSAEWLITTACDTPFIPENLVAALLKDAGEADIIRASSGGRGHHVIAAWRVSLAAELEQAILSGTRRMTDWTENRHRRLRNVDFPQEPYDPFFNINLPEDLAKAENLAASRRGQSSRSRSG